jgi:hypothetical protein
LHIEEKGQQGGICDDDTALQTTGFEMNSRAGTGTLPPRFFIFPAILATNNVRYFHGRNRIRK